MCIKVGNLSDFILSFCVNKETTVTNFFFFFSFLAGKFCTICWLAQKLPGPNALKLHDEGTWKTAYLVQPTQVTPSNWMGMLRQLPYLSLLPIPFDTLPVFVARTLDHELAISSLKAEVTVTDVALLICNFFMQVCRRRTQFCWFPTKMQSEVGKLRLKPPF